MAVARKATVLIPGVLSTRLRLDPKGSDAVRWDPDSTSAMLPWINNSAATKRIWLHAELTPATILNERRKPLSDLEVERGWSALPQDFFFPDTLRRLKNDSGGNRFFVLGYDWRQDLMTLGSWAAKKLRRIQDRAEADGGLVLLTHSMGGLVARAALRSDSKLESAGVVKSAIHVMQPAVGTPLVYRRFLTGSIEDAWDDPFSLLFFSILGLSRQSYALNMSGAPGPCQLLPSDEYRDTTLSSTGSPEWWIHGQPEQPVADFYRREQPPGIILDSLSQQIKEELNQRLDQVFAFQNWLGKVQFAHTWSIVGNGYDTETRTAVFSGQEPKGLFSIGDETVALDSARAIGPSGRGRMAVVNTKHGMPYPEINDETEPLVELTIDFLREAQEVN